MNRFIFCWCVSVTVCGGTSRAAAPPVVPAIRSISLAEAAKRALEHGGYRVVRGDDGTLCVSPPSRSDYLEALRIANQTLLNAEVAYWNLYAARKFLFARKEARCSSRRLLRICNGRQWAGTGSEAEIAQARTQYDSFRTQCRQASDHVAESERQLVALMGLEAGSRLRPSDRPLLAQQRPDWDASLREALARRPELRMARNSVFFGWLILFVERSLESLSGVPCERLWILTQKKRYETSRYCGRYLVGPLTLRQVLGRWSLDNVRDQEGKAQNFLELYYRRIHLNYKQIESTLALREAFAERHRLLTIEYAAGRCSLDALLEVRQKWIDASGSASQAITTYNNALAGFDFGKGTTLDRHHMVFVP